MGKVERTCETCGKHFSVWPAHLRRSAARFCSWTCRYPQSATACFWSKVDKSAGPSNCWIWTGARYTGGYGLMFLEGRRVLAHRFAYELLHGPVPEGMCVLHSCNVRVCVNQAHLRLGTDLDNAKQREADGRGKQPRGEQHGNHKLTEVQVLEIRALYAMGEWSRDRLGERFGVHPESVSNIIRNKTWKHVKKGSL